MHTYYETKDMLKKELDDIVKKGELSAGSLETIDKLLDSIKNACKIIMYEEYSDDEGEYSRRGGYSMADGMMNGNYSMVRGRGSNARRDSMGRYSRNEYSRRGGSRDGYSYDEGKDEKVQILREMMNEVGSDEERRTIQKIIRRMENE